MSKKNLLIAFGGVSPEHEVSVLTAIQAASALKNSPWNIVPLYLSKDGRWLSGERLLELEVYKNLAEAESLGIPCHFARTEYGQTGLILHSGKWFSKPQVYLIDVVLCAFHGSEGENGAFQGLCETHNIPYTGSGVAASALAMDKRLAKDLCVGMEIPVVEDIRLSENEWETHQDEMVDSAEKMSYPLYVKPATLGSSIGVFRVHERYELIEAVESALRYDSCLLIEKAIQPLMEINCSVLGDGEETRTSVCEQPLGKEELLSFEDKYGHGNGGAKGMAAARRVIPAPIDEEQARKIQEYSLRIFQRLGCSGVARLDFFIHQESGNIYFNEINTLPGSFSFYLWEASEISFETLLEKLIAIGIRRHQQKNSRVRSYEVNLLSKKAIQGLKGLKGGK